MSEPTLDRREVEAVYDRIGGWQDTQSFYEVPAFDALIAHAEFERATSILEVGCGTGRLAERILRSHAPPEAQYEGVDVSATMVQIARERLAPFGERATVRKTDGRLVFDRPAGSVDRFVATYLFDLLSREDARVLLAEAHRLLQPGPTPGRLCVAGLTWGSGLLSGGVTRLWAAVHALGPRWVGGCRPIDMQSLLLDEQWRELHHGVVTSWGVPSEVLVASPVQP